MFEMAFSRQIVSNKGSLWVAKPDRATQSRSRYIQGLRTPPLPSPQIRGGRQQKNRSPPLIEGRVVWGLRKS